MERNSYSYFAVLIENCNPAERQISGRIRQSSQQFVVLKVEWILMKLRRSTSEFSPLLPRSNITTAGTPSAFIFRFYQKYFHSLSLKKGKLFLNHQFQKMGPVIFELKPFLNLARALQRTLILSVLSNIWAFQILWNILCFCKNKEDFSMNQEKKGA